MSRLAFLRNLLVSSASEKKTKKFFLTGIAENVKEKQILSYLEHRNIFPTYISVFPSRRRGTLSCKIHIPLAVSTFIGARR